MILIIAGNLDDEAKLLKAKWHRGDATLLTVDDLTMPGWQISVTDFNTSHFIAEGTVWPVTEVTAIINILPVVSPFELFSIVKDDRQYVASELNAFLFYFLSKFKCPFLNNPSAFNLSGPSIKHNEWIKECVKASLPVYNTRSVSEEKFYYPSETNVLQSATFLNNLVYSDNQLNFTNELSTLASNTGLNYFTIYFKEHDSKYFFYNLTTYPNFSDEKLFKLLQQFFTKT